MFCLYVINICSAVVLNYDLLVGDMTFYNQTLSFALSENEKHGTDMLELIENLMAPWHKNNLADSDETVSVNECIIESEILINLVIIIRKISSLVFFVTAVFMIMSLPFNIYLMIKKILNSTNDEDNIYDESKSKTSSTREYTDYYIL